MPRGSRPCEERHIEGDTGPGKHLGVAGFPERVAHHMGAGEDGPVADEESGTGRVAVPVPEADRPGGEDGVGVLVFAAPGSGRSSAGFVLVVHGASSER
ncbi:hypothetical protein PS467_09045 [Streptomyces luomodiensis]|uniref:Uncharacterized protein n=1 Tax=Streptomyces luomodiensis TaxID=3026192 RepID=A0ABY9USE9_9ACTN|nr:hypothetical protein [Streptomyces sp. SCA4-21]WNE95480.1 hypothetical protein PS467_09045 [Streptomyces sp. SCA4-21]